VLGIGSCAAWLFGDINTEIKNSGAVATSFTQSLVSSGWTLDAFRDTATAGYLLNLKTRGAAAFDAYKVLGEPKSIAACTNIHLEITNGEGNAELTCPASFANGNATLLLDLYKPVIGTWKVQNLKLEL